MPRSQALLIVASVAMVACKESTPALRDVQTSQLHDGRSDRIVDAKLETDLRADVARTDAHKTDTTMRADGASTTWKVVAHETFDSLALANTSWREDEVPDDGPFADNGEFFKRTRGAEFRPPAAYRMTVPFGGQGWLTLESYTRDNTTQLSDLVSATEDPAGGSNRVLRLRSPRHTDATVIRPSQALPARYRVSLRVGYANFGSGQAPNGYDDSELAGPWRDDSAQTDNGFYWLAILDAVPRPHNNIWIHHHRKVVVDSDNHFPEWINMWDGASYKPSGVHPVMMIAIDGADKSLPEWRVKIGKPFRAFSNGAWRRELELGEIRGLDAYKPNTWYNVSIERSVGRFVFEVSGDFQYGGQRTYHAELAYDQACVWHFNQPGETVQNEDCLDQKVWPNTSQAVWPAGTGWPDYFMFGDPHVNYYEGQVYYDDLKLELPAT